MQCFVNGLEQSCGVNESGSIINTMWTNLMIVGLYMLGIAMAFGVHRWMKGMQKRVALLASQVSGFYTILNFVVGNLVALNSLVVKTHKRLFTLVKRNTWNHGRMILLLCALIGASLLFFRRRKQKIYKASESLKNEGKMEQVYAAVKKQNSQHIAETLGSVAELTIGVNKQNATKTILGLLVTGLGLGALIHVCYEIYKIFCTDVDDYTEAVGTVHDMVTVDYESEDKKFVSGTIDSRTSLKDISNVALMKQRRVFIQVPDSSHMDRTYVWKELTRDCDKTLCEFKVIRVFIGRAVPTDEHVRNQSLSLAINSKGLSIIRVKEEERAVLCTDQWRNVYDLFACVFLYGGETVKAHVHNHMEHIKSVKRTTPYKDSFQAYGRVETYVSTYNARKTFGDVDDFLIGALKLVEGTRELDDFVLYIHNLTLMKRRLMSGFVGQACSILLKAVKVAEKLYMTDYMKDNGRFRWCNVCVDKEFSYHSGMYAMKKDRYDAAIKMQWKLFCGKHFGGTMVIGAPSLEVYKAEFLHWTDRFPGINQVTPTCSIYVENTSDADKGKGQDDPSEFEVQNTLGEKEDDLVIKDGTFENVGDDNIAKRVYEKVEEELLVAYHDKMEELEGNGERKDNKWQDMPTSDVHDLFAKVDKAFRDDLTPIGDTKEEYREIGSYARVTQAAREWATAMKKRWQLGTHIASEKLLRFDSWAIMHFWLPLGLFVVCAVILLVMRYMFCKRVAIKNESTFHAYDPTDVIKNANKFWFKSPDGKNRWYTGLVGDYKHNVRRVNERLRSLFIIGDTVPVTFFRDINGKTRSFTFDLVVPSDLEDEGVTLLKGNADHKQQRVLWQEKKLRQRAPPKPLSERVEAYEQKRAELGISGDSGLKKESEPGVVPETQLKKEAWVTPEHTKRNLLVTQEGQRLGSIVRVGNYFYFPSHYRTNLWSDECLDKEMELDIGNVQLGYMAWTLTYKEIEILKSNDMARCRIQAQHSCLPQWTKMSTKQYPSGTTVHVFILGWSPEGHQSCQSAYATVHYEKGKWETARWVYTGYHFNGCCGSLIIDSKSFELLALHTQGHKDDDVLYCVGSAFPADIGDLKKESNLTKLDGTIVGVTPARLYKKLGVWKTNANYVHHNFLVVGEGKTYVAKSSITQDERYAQFRQEAGFDQSGSHGPVDLTMAAFERNLDAFGHRFVGDMNILGESLEESIDMMSEFIGPCQLMTNTEVIEGIHDSSGTRVLEPMDLKTAGGYGFSEIAKTKAEIIEKEPDMIKKLAQDDFRSLQTLAPYLWIYRLSLKDEKRDFVRVCLQKARVFSANNLIAVLSERRVSGYFNAQFYMAGNNPRCPWKPGFNVFGGAWHNLIYYLTQGFQQMFKMRTIDVAKWDKRYSWLMHEINLRVRLHFFSIGWEDIEVDVFGEKMFITWDIMEQILTCIYYRRSWKLGVTPDGKIIVMHDDNPSGTVDTVVDNTVAHYVVLVDWFFRLMKKHHPEFANQTCFKTFVALALYGDDNGHTVDELVEKILTPESLEEQYRIFGWEATWEADDGQKEVDIFRFNFLSRKTVAIGLNRSYFVPVLESHRILAIIEYRQKASTLSDDLMRAIAAREMAFPLLFSDDKEEQDVYCVCYFYMMRLAREAYEKHDTIGEKVANSIKSTRQLIEFYVGAPLEVDLRKITFILENFKRRYQNESELNGNLKNESGVPEEGKGKEKVSTHRVKLDIHDSVKADVKYNMEYVDKDDFDKNSLQELLQKCGLPVPVYKYGMGINDKGKIKYGAEMECDLGTCSVGQRYVNKVEASNAAAVYFLLALKDSELMGEDSQALDVFGIRLAALEARVAQLEIEKAIHENSMINLMGLLNVRPGGEVREEELKKEGGKPFRGSEFTKERILRNSTTGDEPEEYDCDSEETFGSFGYQGLGWGTNDEFVRVWADSECGRRSGSSGGTIVRNNTWLIDPSCLKDEGGKKQSSDQRRIVRARTDMTETEKAAVSRVKQLENTVKQLSSSRGERGPRSLAQRKRWMFELGKVDTPWFDVGGVKFGNDANLGKKTYKAPGKKPVHFKGAAGQKKKPEKKKPQPKPFNKKGKLNYGWEDDNEEYVPGYRRRSVRGGEIMGTAYAARGSRSRFNIRTCGLDEECIEGTDTLQVSVQAQSYGNANTPVGALQYTTQLNPSDPNFHGTRMHKFASCYQKFWVEEFDVSWDPIEGTNTGGQVIGGFCQDPDMVWNDVDPTNYSRLASASMEEPVSIWQPHTWRYRATGARTDLYIDGDGSDDRFTSPAQFVLLAASSISSGQSIGNLTCRYKIIFSNRMVGDGAGSQAFMNSNGGETPALPYGNGVPVDDTNTTVRQNLVYTYDTTLGNWTIPNASTTNVVYLLLSKLTGTGLTGQVLNQVNGSGTVTEQKNAVSATAIISLYFVQPTPNAGGGASNFSWKWTATGTTVTGAEQYIIVLPNVTNPFPEGVMTFRDMKKYIDEIDEERETVRKLTSAVQLLEKRVGPFIEPIDDEGEDEPEIVDDGEPKSEINDFGDHRRESIREIRKVVFEDEDLLGDDEIHRLLQERARAKAAREK